MASRPATLDRLTPRERELVSYKLAHPTATLVEIAKAMKMRGKPRHLTSNVRRMLNRGPVKVALAYPLPQLTGKNVKITPEFIRRRTRDIALDPATPTSERLRALRMLAEMTPGTIVPARVDNTHSFNLEQFVEAAGGKPHDVPSVINKDEERRLDS